jgi:hypothetical protein
MYHPFSFFLPNRQVKLLYCLLPSRNFRSKVVNTQLFYCLIYISIGNVKNSSKKFNFNKLRQQIIIKELANGRLPLEKLTVSQTIKWTPNFYRTQRFTAVLTNGLLLSYPVSILSLKMEAICLFETFVNFYQTTWRHISKDNILRLICLQLCASVTLRTYCHVVCVTIDRVGIGECIYWPLTGRNYK